MASPVQPIARLSLAAGAGVLAILLATVVFRAPAPLTVLGGGPAATVVPTPPATVQTTAPATAPQAFGAPTDAPFPQPTDPLCQLRTRHVAGGQYILSNDEYNSSASECIQTDGNADFTVQNSDIYSTTGSPGAYPDIYKGCAWGSCTYNSGFPVQVSAMNPGEVTTSWSITQPGGSDMYDAAYDIWFNQTSYAPTQPNGAELMVWLARQGGVQPFGREIAYDVSIGGDTFDVWEGAQHDWDTVSYVLVGGANSVTGLDVDLLTQDSVDRGYIQPSWYLIDVEAGFELWRGGAGLATNSFSVDVRGAGD